MPVGVENHIIHVSHEVAQSNIRLCQGRGVNNLFVLLEVLSDSSPAIFLIFDPVAEVGVAGWIRAVLYLPILFFRLSTGLFVFL